MSFARYPTYKNSGVEWLGEIPDHWSLQPLKQQFQIVGGSTPKSDVDDFWDGDVAWATPADLGKGDTWYIAATQRRITKSGLQSCAAMLVPANSIVLSTRAPIGSLGITTVPMCTNQGCRSLIPSSSTCTDFFAYMLSIATDELMLRGKGTTFLELSGNELGAFRVSVPPLCEQTMISTFLAGETAKIDALIAEQLRLIELLKEKRQAVISHAVTKGLNPDAPMKPSGVEWIGDVPSHWQVFPLHRLVQSRRRITYGIVQPGEPDEHGRFMIRGQDYSSAWAAPSAIFRVSDAIETPYKRARLMHGDLVITIVGAGVGNIAVVPEWLEGANITQTTARIAIDPDKADATYVAAVLSGPIGRRSVELFAKGAAQPGLNLEHVRIFSVTVPPIVEQRAIAGFIIRETAAFDSLAEAAERAITLLQERRTAMISAAITGKIDVRNYVASQAA